MQLTDVQIVQAVSTGCSILLGSLGIMRAIRKAAKSLIEAYKVHMWQHAVNWSVTNKHHPHDVPEYPNVIPPRRTNGSL